MYSYYALLIFRKFELLPSCPTSADSERCFAKQLCPESISHKVAQRVAAYEGTKEQWHREWFQSTLPALKIGLISWEEIIATIQECDPVAGAGLEAFYQKALMFNS